MGTTLLCATFLFQMRLHHIIFCACAFASHPSEDTEQHKPFEIGLVEISKKVDVLNTDLRFISENMKGIHKTEQNIFKLIKKNVNFLKKTLMHINEAIIKSLKKKEKQVIQRMKDDQVEIFPTETYYNDMRIGESEFGKKCKFGDELTIKVTGYLEDGTIFWSSGREVEKLVVGGSDGLAGLNQVSYFITHLLFVCFLRVSLV